MSPEPSDTGSGTHQASSQSSGHAPKGGEPGQDPEPQAAVAPESTPAPTPEQVANDALEQRVRNGEAEALAQMFERDRGRLRRMIDIRMDPRLRHRVDPEDVLQDVFLDASKRLRSFGEQPDLGGYLWLRLIAGQTLIDTYRRHLGAQRRSLRGEVRLSGRGPMATSESISIQLTANLSSPSQAAMRAERAHALREALDRMDDLDREVLVLRHFEELTNGEVAAFLGLQKTAASNRYIRALERLRGLMGAADLDRSGPGSRPAPGAP